MYSQQNISFIQSCSKQVTDKERREWQHVFKDMQLCWGPYFELGLPVATTPLLQPHTFRKILIKG